ncbi:microtubule-associated protein futsch [Triticum aestivum]|uniref:microtubule-associated protein futsch n=1 Tax=Triticum aestivum TaxID=4565 RepID=UPI001D033B0D|nr:microtubule-associated protein futsch-like [Triticum aestivum]
MAGLGIGAPIVKVYHEKSIILPDVSRVLACLYEKGIDFERETFSSYKSLLRLQASSHVPVPFYDGPNKFLEESREICRHIAETYEDHGYPFLLGKDSLERASIEEWLHHEEHNFNPPSRSLFCHLAFPVAEEDDDIDLQTRKLEDVLEVYEQRLGDSEFLAGNKFTLADLVHLPNSYHITNSEKFLYLYDSRKNVQRWWHAISSRGSWQKVLKVMHEVERQNKQEELDKQQQRKQEELQKQQRRQWRRQHPPTSRPQFRLHSREQPSTKPHTILVPPPVSIIAASPTTPQAEEPHPTGTSPDETPVSSSRSIPTTHKPSDVRSKHTTISTTHEETPPAYVQSTPRIPKKSPIPVERRINFFTPATSPTTTEKPSRTGADKPRIGDASLPSEATEIDLPTKSKPSSSKKASDKLHDFYEASRHTDEAEPYTESTSPKPSEMLDEISETDGPSNVIDHAETSPRLAKEDSDRLRASGFWTENTAPNADTQDKKSVRYTERTSQRPVGNISSRATDQRVTYTSPEKPHSTEALEPASMDEQLPQGPERTTQTPYTAQRRDVSSMPWQRAADVQGIAKEDGASSRGAVRPPYARKDAAEARFPADRRKDASLPKGARDDTQAIPLYDDDTNQEARETASAPRRTRAQDPYDTSEGTSSRSQPTSAPHDAVPPPKQATSEGPYAQKDVVEARRFRVDHRKDAPLPKRVRDDTQATPLYDDDDTNQEARETVSAPRRARAQGPYYTSEGTSSRSQPVNAPHDAVPPPKRATSEGPYARKDVVEARRFPADRRKDAPLSKRVQDDTQATPLYDDDDTNQEARETASAPRRTRAQDPYDTSEGIGTDHFSSSRPHPVNAPHDAVPPPKQAASEGSQRATTPYLAAQEVFQQGRKSPASRPIVPHDAQGSTEEEETVESSSKAHPLDSHLADVRPPNQFSDEDGYGAMAPLQTGDTDGPYNEKRDRGAAGPKRMMSPDAFEETKMTDSASFEAQTPDHRQADAPPQKQRPTEDPQTIASPSKKRYSDDEDTAKQAKHAHQKLQSEQWHAATTGLSNLKGETDDFMPPTQQEKPSKDVQHISSRDAEQANTRPLAQEPVGMDGQLVQGPERTARTSPTRYPRAEETSKQPRAPASIPTHIAAQDARDVFRESKVADSTPLQKRYPDAKDVAKKSKVTFEETKHSDSAPSRGQPLDSQRADAPSWKKEAADAPSRGQPFYSQRADSPSWKKEATEDPRSTAPVKKRHSDVEDTTKQSRDNGFKPRQIVGQDAQGTYKETKPSDPVSYREQQSSDTWQAAPTLREKITTEGGPSVTPPSKRRSPSDEDTIKQPRGTAPAPRRTTSHDADVTFQDSKPADSMSSREQPLRSRQEVEDSRSKTSAFDKTRAYVEDSTRQAADTDFGPRQNGDEDTEDITEEKKVADSAPSVRARHTYTPRTARPLSQLAEEEEDAQDKYREGRETARPLSQQAQEEEDAHDKDREGRDTVSAPKKMVSRDAHDTYGERRTPHSTSTSPTPSKAQPADSRSPIKVERPRSIYEEDHLVGQDSHKQPQTLPTGGRADGSTLKHQQDPVVPSISEEKSSTPPAPPRARVRDDHPTEEPFKGDIVDDRKGSPPLLGQEPTSQVQRATELSQKAAPDGELSTIDQWRRTSVPLQGDDVLGGSTIDQKPTPMSEKSIPSARRANEMVKKEQRMVPPARTGAQTPDVQRAPSSFSRADTSERDGEPVQMQAPTQHARPTSVPTRRATPDARDTSDQEFANKSDAQRWNALKAKHDVAMTSEDDRNASPSTHAAAVDNKTALPASEAQSSGTWPGSTGTPVNAQPTSDDARVGRFPRDQGAQPPESTQAQPPFDAPHDSVSTQDVPRDTLGKTKSAKPSSTEGMTPTAGPAPTLKARLAEQKSAPSDQQLARAAQPTSTEGMPPTAGPQPTFKAQLAEQKFAPSDKKVARAAPESSKEGTGFSAPEKPQTIFRQEARPSAPITKQVPSSDAHHDTRKIKHVTLDNFPPDVSPIPPFPSREQVPHAPQTFPNKKDMAPAPATKDSLAPDTQIASENVQEAIPDNYRTDELTVPLVSSGKQGSYAGPFTEPQEGPSPDAHGAADDKDITKYPSESYVRPTSGSDVFPAVKKSAPSDQDSIQSAQQSSSAETRKEETIVSAAGPTLPTTIGKDTQGSRRPIKAERTPSAYQEDHFVAQDSHEQPQTLPTGGRADDSTPKRQQDPKDKSSTPPAPPRARVREPFRDTVDDQKGAPLLGQEPTSQVQRATELSQEEAAPDGDMSSKPSTIDQWRRTSVPLQGITPNSGDDVLGGSTIDQKPTPMSQQSIPSARGASEMVEKDQRMAPPPRPGARAPDVLSAPSSFSATDTAERDGEPVQMQAPTLHDQGAQPRDSVSTQDVPSDSLDKTNVAKSTSTEGKAAAPTFKAQLAEEKFAPSDKKLARAARPTSTEGMTPTAGPAPTSKAQLPEQKFAPSDKKPEKPQTIFRQEARPSAPITKQVPSSDAHVDTRKIQQVTLDNVPTDDSSIPPFPSHDQVSHAPQAFPSKNDRAPAPGTKDSPASDTQIASAKVQETMPDNYRTDELTVPSVSSEKQGSYAGSSTEPHEGSSPDAYGATDGKDITKYPSRQAPVLEYRPDSTPADSYVRPISGSEVFPAVKKSAPSDQDSIQSAQQPSPAETRKEETIFAAAGPTFPTTVSKDTQVSRRPIKAERSPSAYQEDHLVAQDSHEQPQTLPTGGRADDSTPKRQQDPKDKSSTPPAPPRARVRDEHPTEEPFNGDTVDEQKGASPLLGQEPTSQVQRATELSQEAAPDGDMSSKPSTIGQWQRTSVPLQGITPNSGDDVLGGSTIDQKPTPISQQSIPSTRGASEMVEKDQRMAPPARPGARTPDVLSAPSSFSATDTAERDGEPVQMQAPTLHDQGAQPPESTQAQSPFDAPRDSVSTQDVPSDALDKTNVAKPTSTEGKAPAPTSKAQLAEEKFAPSDKKLARATRPTSTESMTPAAGPAPTSKAQLSEQNFAPSDKKPEKPQTIFRQEARPSAPITKQVPSSDAHHDTRKIQQFTLDNVPTDDSSIPPFPSHDQVSHAPQAFPSKKDRAPAPGTTDSPASNTLIASAKVQETMPDNYRTDELTVPSVSSEKQGSYAGSSTEPHVGSSPDAYGAADDKDMTKYPSRQAPVLEYRPDSTPADSYVRPISGSEVFPAVKKSAPSDQNSIQSAKQPSPAETKKEETIIAAAEPTLPTIVGKDTEGMRGTPTLDYEPTGDKRADIQSGRSDEVALPEQKSRPSDRDSARSTQSRSSAEPMDKELNYPSSAKPLSSATPDQTKDSQPTIGQQAPAPGTSEYPSSGEGQVYRTKPDFELSEGPLPYSRSVIGEKTMRPPSSQAQSSDSKPDPTQNRGDDPSTRSLPNQVAKQHAETQPPPTLVVPYDSESTQDVTSDTLGKAKSLKPSSIDQQATGSASTPDTHLGGASGELARPGQELPLKDQDSANSTQKSPSSEPQKEQSTVAAPNQSKASQATSEVLTPADQSIAPSEPLSVVERNEEFTVAEAEESKVSRPVIAQQDIKHVPDISEPVLDNVSTEEQYQRASEPREGPPPDVHGTFVDRKTAPSSSQAQRPDAKRDVLPLSADVDKKTVQPSSQAQILPSSVDVGPSSDEQSTTRLRRDQEAQAQLPAATKQPQPFEAPVYPKSNQDAPKSFKLPSGDQDVMSPKVVPASASDTQFGKVSDEITDDGQNSPLSAQDIARSAQRPFFVEPTKEDDIVAASGQTNEARPISGQRGITPTPDKQRIPDLRGAVDEKMSLPSSQAQNSDIRPDSAPIGGDVHRTSGDEPATSSVRDSQARPPAGTQNVPAGFLEKTKSPRPPSTDQEPMASPAPAPDAPQDQDSNRSSPVSPSVVSRKDVANADQTNVSQAGLREPPSSDAKLPSEEIQESSPDAYLTKSEKPLPMKDPVRPPHEASFDLLSGEKPTMIKGDQASTISDVSPSASEEVGQSENSAVKGPLPAELVSSFPQKNLEKTSPEEKWNQQQQTDQSTTRSSEDNNIEASGTRNPNTSTTSRDIQPSPLKERMQAVEGSRNQQQSDQAVFQSIQDNRAQIQETKARDTGFDKPEVIRPDSAPTSGDAHRTSGDGPTTSSLRDSQAQSSAGTENVPAVYSKKESPRPLSIDQEVMTPMNKPTPAPDSLQDQYSNHASQFTPSAISRKNVANADKTNISEAGLQGPASSDATLSSEQIQESRPDDYLTKSEKEPPMKGTDPVQPPEVAAFDLPSDGKPTMIKGDQVNTISSVSLSASQPVGQSESAVERPLSDELVSPFPEKHLEKRSPEEKSNQQQQTDQSSTRLTKDDSIESSGIASPNILTTSGDIQPSPLKQNNQAAERSRKQQQADPVFQSTQDNKRQTEETEAQDTGSDQHEEINPDSAPTSGDANRTSGDGPATSSLRNSQAQPPAETQNAPAVFSEKIKSPRLPSTDQELVTPLTSPAPTPDTPQGT